MLEVSIVIPNYNGIKFIEGCLCSLKEQRNAPEFEIMVVDNGSADGSIELIKRKFPEVTLISLEENFGFCKAVNIGIKSAKTPYVILLNNDTKVHELFVSELVKGIKKYPNAFSCAALLLDFKNRALVDDAGDFYTALGWAYARGKGRNMECYQKATKIFASCGGAAIYKKELFKEIGYFDESHFAYLEDIDLGYRARIFGYDNYYIPSAKVYHLGSATSGSRYNAFKVKYSSRNNIYMIRKNMPLAQIVLNLPLLCIGFGIKMVFFLKKGLGKEYVKGLISGIEMSDKNTKVPFNRKKIGNYVKIQLEIWNNCVKLLRKI